MPIQTDLSVSPYFDDYDEKNDYYKVLFRPGVSVQVRELNQLQSILQKQIERFGDNIYKRGSIIDGCGFVFHTSLPYAKINDQEVDGTPVNVSSYKGFFAKNNTGLIAQIIETSSGFESTAPDLNTLHLKYVNHGESGNESAFATQQTLFIYNPSLVVSGVDINVKSSGFSNTDTAVFLSAITVEDTNGGQFFTNTVGQACTFIVGDILTQEVTGAKAEIREVNTTSNNTHLVLKIRPLASQLKISNTSSWTFLEGYSFTTDTSLISANLKNIIGSGATGSVITDLTGGILSCSVSAGGSGYYVEPYVSVAYRVSNTTTAAETAINALSLTAKTYAAKVVVNADNSAIGNGFGFSVGEGVIYQKGYFSRVSDQFIVVDKYNAQTNNVVGFDTTEEIATFRTDETLYDNATGTLNYNAPGASRLKLSPVLTVMTKDESAANTDFFNIVEFSEGRPYKQNNVTKFNSISKEMAKRTYEESGDYVLDQFLVTTQSPNLFSDETNSFELYVDPGLAYIDGYRVERTDGYSVNVDKGVDTVIANTQVSLNYGNYIKVKELGGIFNFAIGGTISLRDTAKTYLSTGTLGTITATGNEIGKARVRSLQLITGTAGSPSAQYWMYIFDVRMNVGKNFHDVRSVYYSDSTSSGIADVVLTAGDALIFDPQNSTMLFPTGANALKNANNLSYTYRSVNQTASCNTQGFISISVAQNPGEYFPYTGSLTEAEKSTVVVIPLANAVATVNSSGQVTTSTLTRTVTGTSTNFLNDYSPGDYIRLANSSTLDYRQVASIANSTSLTLTSNSVYSFSAANTALAFPAFVPVPLYGRTNRNVTVLANTTLQISLGNSVTTSVGTAVVFDAQRNISAVPKTVTRTAYVKIRTADNVATNRGPWNLGIPDIIRLNNVYSGNSTAVTTSDTKVTGNFWIDHNQRKDYYDTGYLYKNSKYSVSDNIYLLVEFDVLTTTEEGLKTIASYPVNDTYSYSNSVSTINTLEIPEMYHDNDQYVDMRDYLDFRPYSSNSAIITTTASSATINPPELTQSNRFSPTTDKKYPSPQSDCTLTYERYLGRVDSVVMTSNNDIRILRGRPSLNPVPPILPNEGLFIENLIISPYPSLPKNKGVDVKKFLDRKIASIKFTTKRQGDYTVRQPINPDGTKQTQQKRYTMADIGQLEKRITDLEYYTALSFTENTINNLQIPSTANSATNRFKFGFFVDNFTTTNFSDVNDPYYNAQVFGYRLNPKKEQLNCHFTFNLKDSETGALVDGDKIMLPSTEVNLINQNRATEPTAVNVVVTSTTKTETGTSTTTYEVKRISTTAYNVLTQNNVANGALFGYTTEVRDLSPGFIPGPSAQSVKNSERWTYEFSVGKRAGNIYFSAGKQEDADYPFLERYNESTTQWTRVATATRKVGKTWELSYNYVPNASASNRLFRMRSNSNDGNNSLYSGSKWSHWPRTEDIQTPKSGTEYKLTQSTTQSTVISQVPETTEAITTTVVTNSLFNSNMTAQVNFDTLFSRASSLNSPFVDLAQYIQTDLGNNT